MAVPPPPPAPHAPSHQPNCSTATKSTEVELKGETPAKRTLCTGFGFCSDTDWTAQRATLSATKIPQPFGQKFIILRAQTLLLFFRQ